MAAITDNQRFRLNEIWRTFQEGSEGEFKEAWPALNGEMKRIFAEQDRSAAGEMIGMYFENAEQGVIAYLRLKNLLTINKYNNV